MSSLFQDAIRALVACDVSGRPPPTTQQALAYANERRQYEASRRGLCPAELDYYDDVLVCGLAKGHNGRHLYESSEDLMDIRVTWLPEREAAP